MRHSNQCAMSKQKICCRRKKENHVEERGMPWCASLACVFAQALQIFMSAFSFVKTWCRVKLKRTKLPTLHPFCCKVKIHAAKNYSSLIYGERSFSACFFSSCDDSGEGFLQLVEHWEKLIATNASSLCLLPIHKHHARCYAKSWQEACKTCVTCVFFAAGCCFSMGG